MTYTQVEETVGIYPPTLFFLTFSSSPLVRLLEEGVSMAKRSAEPVDKTQEAKRGRYYQLEVSLSH